MTYSGTNKTVVSKCEVSAELNSATILNDLTKIRKGQQVKQQEYAERCGLRQQAISRIERGKQGVTLSTACKLAWSLGYELVLQKID